LLLTQFNPPVYFCAAVLIASNQALTAAHCVWNKGQPKLMSVDKIIIKFGAHDLTDINEPNTIIRVPSEIIIHSHWNASDLKYNDDLAMLLFDDVPFSVYVQPICLADIPPVRDANEGIAAAWGKSENPLRRSEPLPRHATLPIIDIGRCYSEFPNLAIYGARHFCAGSSTSQVCTG